jgi:two-component system sensor histidine kinase YesM
MSTVERGDLSARAELSHNNDELDRIASGLNSMIININDHINTEYISELQRKNAELKQREAELKALQAEINPHFLYNTLESIRMQALLNEDQDTASLIRLLANLFRSRIKSGNVVKIKNEIIYCKSLIEILSARYGGTIEFTHNISKEIEEYGILRDLLQPILENAFIHGFHEEYERKKYLSLSGTIVNGIINFKVRNSGEHIEETKLRHIKAYLEYPDFETENESSGLLNVHQRSRLVYGDEYGISIDSDYKIGTTVDLKIQALTVIELKTKVH